MCVDSIAGAKILRERIAKRREGRPDFLAQEDSHSDDSSEVVARITLWTAVPHTSVDDTESDA